MMPSGSVCTIALRSRLRRDRKSTRLNSSHLGISYAVFCLKKNVRLFDEIQDKRRQLEEANAHKSPFLAYTELSHDALYGEPPEKMKTVLERIFLNSKQLPGLINPFLDHSNFEA